MLEINPNEDIAPQYIEAVVGQKLELTKPSFYHYYYTNAIWMFSYGPIRHNNEWNSNVVASTIHLYPFTLKSGGIYTCWYADFIAHVEVKVFCKCLKIQFLIDEQEK